jgi:hypothetical protein
MTILLDLIHSQCGVRLEQIAQLQIHFFSESLSSSALQICKDLTTLRIISYPQNFFCAALYTILLMK